MGCWVAGPWWPGQGGRARLVGLCWRGLAGRTLARCGKALGSIWEGLGGGKVKCGLGGRPWEALGWPQARTHSKSATYTHNDSTSTRMLLPVLLLLLLPLLLMLVLLLLTLLLLLLLLLMLLLPLLLLLLLML